MYHLITGSVNGHCGYKHKDAHYFKQLAVCIHCEDAHILLYMHAQG